MLIDEDVVAREVTMLDASSVHEADGRDNLLDPAQAEREGQPLDHWVPEDASDLWVCHTLQQEAAISGPITTENAVMFAGQTLVNPLLKVDQRPLTLVERQLEYDSETQAHPRYTLRDEVAHVDHGNGTFDHIHLTTIEDDAEALDGWMSRYSPWEAQTILWY